MNIFNLSTKKEAIPVGLKKQDSSNILQKIQGMWKKQDNQKEYVFTNNSLWLAGKSATEEIVKAHYLHHEENNGNFIYLAEDEKSLIVSRLPIYICNWNQEREKSEKASEIAINFFDSLIEKHHFEKIFFSEKMVKYFKSCGDEHLAFKITHLLSEARFNKVNINTDLIEKMTLRATDKKELQEYIKEILLPYKELEKSGEINENSSFTLDLLINNKVNVAFILNHNSLVHTELKKTIIKYCNSILNHEKDNSYRIYSLNMNDELLSECYENIASHEFVITDQKLSQETFEKYNDIALALNQLNEATPQWFLDYIKQNNSSKVALSDQEKECLTLFDNHKMFSLDTINIQEIKSPIMNDEVYTLYQEKYLQKLVNVAEKAEIEKTTKK